MTPCAIALRYGGEHHEPAAVPVRCWAPELVDAFGSLDEELFAAAGETPPSTSADPLRLQPSCGRGARQCLSYRAGFDIEPTEYLEERGRPRQPTGRQQELTNDGEKKPTSRISAGRMPTQRCASVSVATRVSCITCRRLSGVRTSRHGRLIVRVSPSS